MKKGYLIRQTFDNRFVHKLEELYDKYGEEIFSIMGIANRHLDIARFSENFFEKSSSVAEVSVDGNANVKEKNIMQYNYENGKALMKLNSIYLLWRWMMECFSEEDADVALEKVISGELFINDLTNYQMPYCYAFDLRILLSEGMNFFKGNMNIKPPKRSNSFFALMIQATAYISNQIMGAASYPDFFVVLDWFYRKEFGDNYVKRLKIGRHNSKEGQSEEHVPLWYEVKNQFQNFIYSMNYPFRGNQSAFTNLSIMDRGFLKELFKDYMIPEGNGQFAKPDLESTLALSKVFYEYYAEINSKEGIFTFPVMTHAISIDENDGHLLDPDFFDWSAEANHAKALANVFQSPPNAFSTCCRLKNDFSKVADVGYQNSFGVGGLSIGSHRVAGLNLPRMAILEKDNPNLLEENLDILHKVLYSHRQLIKNIIDGGHLPLYPTGWINLQRQYSTIGFVGAYEYVINKGLDIRTDEGIDEVTRILSTIESKIVEWQNAEKDERNIYNIEQIPAESMAVRLCEMDSVLGYNPQNCQLYSNQYIPLIEDSSIYDRFRIQGKIDGLTSGGAILHINVDDEKPLSVTQFKKVMELALKTGTVYFAINYAYSECESSHYSIGKHDSCPICEKEIVCQYTRVVGFITPVRSWNQVRRDWEYDRRVFYRNGRLEDVYREQEEHDNVLAFEKEAAVAH